MLTIILASVGAIAIALYALHKWATIHRAYFDKRNIPYPKDWLIQRKNIAENTLYLYNQFPDIK